MPRLRLATLTAAAVLLLASPAAAVNPVLSAYQQHGTIPACEFTSRQLEQALGQNDAYGAQYFNDFTSAVQAALQAHAGGACGAAQIHQQQADRAGLALPHNLTSVTGATKAAIPLPMLLLALFAAALLLLAGLIAVARWRAWDPHWAGAWRQMWGEASDRTQSAWAEFTDWWRSGSR